MSLPTLYLSNWSSHRTPGMHGAGRKFTIMARPRAWERGEGSAHLLVPQGFEVAAMQLALADRDDAAAMLKYRTMIESRWASMVGCLAPRVLSHIAFPGMGGGMIGDVYDGDTLCCACSVAEARAGRCHRTWAAPFLVRAGWRVILDGVEVTL